MDALSQFKYSHDGSLSNTIITKRNRLIMIAVIKMGTEKPIAYNQSECGTRHLIICTYMYTWFLYLMKVYEDTHFTSCSYMNRARNDFVPLADNGIQRYTHIALEDHSDNFAIKIIKFEEQYKYHFVQSIMRAEANKHCLFREGILEVSLRAMQHNDQSCLELFIQEIRYNQSNKTISCFLHRLIFLLFCGQ